MPIFKIKDVLPAALLLSLFAAGAAAQEDKVAELEKKLRATQEFFAAELLTIKAEAALAGGAPGGKKELPKVETAARKAQIKGLVRTQYEYVEKGKRRATGAVVAPLTGFSMVHTRLWVDGALNQGVGYRLKADFSNRGTGVLLNEAYISYDIVPEQLIFTIGQRQPKTMGNPPAENQGFAALLNSSDTLKFCLNDRGVALSGRLLRRTVFYEAQLVNGSGVLGTDAANDNTSFLYYLHGRYEPLGEISNAQNDIKRSDLRFGVSATGAHSRDKKIFGVKRQDKNWWNANAYVKWNGLFARALVATQDVKNISVTGKDQLHWSAQAGYAVPVWAGHILEPVARYQFTDLNKDASGWQEEITTVGFNYYLDGDNARVMVNYNFKEEQGTRVINNNSFQVMCALFF
ncbi:MAG: hypothetical protein A2285_00205 [Elusimicrobia bacterium RIFOXYA12_FULL_57_11]|nr:MAG: hypothetical protein A2285_00205 [Elusimicrobia bacterium RIFOXYA12_FULL_57_11]